MRILIFFIAISCYSPKIVAQELLNMDINNTCSYYGETLQGGVYGFNSSDEARNIIYRITDIVGIEPNFEIRAANVPNALVLIEQGKRIILYSENFISSIVNKTGTDWAGISVLAHEIGHHINGHSLTEEGSRHETELEADKFSGFVLAKMGASLVDAQAAISQLDNEKGSATHPPKSARLEAISVGWKKGGGSNTAGSTNTNKSGSNPDESKIKQDNSMNDKNQTGDVCFTNLVEYTKNRSNHHVYLIEKKNMDTRFGSGQIRGGQRVTPLYGEKSCYYELKPGVYNYLFARSTIGQKIEITGQVLIEKGKTKHIDLK